VPRRKAGSLLPLETQILEVAISLLADGESAFYGFALAQVMRKGNDSRSLVSHGTLYKALGRLEEFGFLASRWEDAPTGGRPRRRLYELTAAGIEAAPSAASAQSAQSAQSARAANSDPRPARSGRVAPRPA
jgi:DNA-binding PadR family transcriptional regulator